VLVDWDKPVTVLRDASKSCSLDARQGDNAVGGEQAAWPDAKAAVPNGERVRLRHKLDAAGLEKLANRVARCLSEEAERIGFRSNKDERGSEDVAFLEFGRRHEGKLVDRQRPAGSAGKREGDPLHAASGNIVEQRLKVINRAETRKRQGSNDGLGMCRTACEDERVEGNVFASADLDRSRRGIDRGEKAAAIADPEMSEERLEGDAFVPNRSKGLSHHERRVIQLILRSKNVDQDAVTGEIAQRQCRLDTCNAGAGNDDV
jgi:hypothetical protein